MAAALSSQEEIDRQMSPSRWSPRFADPDQTIADHCSTLEKGSNQARAKLHCELNVPYRDGLTVDIVYPPSGKQKNKLMVYIHGGMWQFLSKALSLYPAQSFVDAGWTFAAVEYTLAPQANMDQIVQECTEAVTFVARRNPQCAVYVSGHSAGAHLAAMVMLSDWRAAGLNLKGCLLLSGLYDLEVVRQCYANAALQLTEQQVQQHSPTRRLEKESCSDACKTLKLHIVFAEHDPTAFRTQAQDFARAALAAGITATTIADVAGRDHFDVTEQLGQADYPPLQAFFADMERE
eukprot:m.155385 g.155385  ORF g.155385 m.155385 type:complete len:292 (+) comp20807_c2_seq1:63-938(+)